MKLLILNIITIVCILASNIALASEYRPLNELNIKKLAAMSKVVYDNYEIYDISLGKVMSPESVKKQNELYFKYSLSMPDWSFHDFHLLSAYVALVEYDAGRVSLEQAEKGILSTYSPQELNIIKNNQKLLSAVYDEQINNNSKVKKDVKLIKEFLYMSYEDREKLKKDSFIR